MAITFVKDTNGKVLVTDGTRKFSLDSSMNVLPHPSDTALIIISDSSAPLETREVFKFGWEQVTVPVITDRNDLIEKLGKNFFYNSFAATITFPTDLAKEDKQDDEIASLGTDGATPPVIAGTGVRGWLRAIYEKLLGTITVSGTVTANAGTNLNTSALNLQTTQAEILETISLGSSQATTTVAGSTSSVLLVSARAKRKEVVVRNDTNKKMYICPFTPATTATPIILDTGQEWILDKFDGAYYSIWDTGVTGNAYITDFYE